MFHIVIITGIVLDVGAVCHLYLSYRRWKSYKYQSDASTQTDYTNNNDQQIQTDIDLITQELTTSFHQFNYNLELNNQDIKQIQQNQIIHHTLLDNFTHSLPTTFQQLTQNLNQMVHITHKILDQLDVQKENLKLLDSHVTEDITQGLENNKKFDEDIQHILEGIYLMDSDFKELNKTYCEKNMIHRIEDKVQYPQSRSPSPSPSPPPYVQHESYPKSRNEAPKHPGIICRTEGKPDRKRHTGDVKMPAF